MSKSESRTQKAIRLLKEKPFEFIDHGRHRGALPENFEPKLGNKDWAKALAVMAVIRSKPGTWQWNSDRLKAAGKLSERTVREGVKKLKEEGWIHHTNVYDERHKHLTTIVLAFSSPIPEHQRVAESRFTLIRAESGWVFGYSREGGRYALRSGVSYSDSYTSVQQAYGHMGTVVRTQTLKRVQSDFSVPSADQPETTQPETPAMQEPETSPTARKATSRPDAPKEPSESEVNDRKQMARKLELLGEKRDDSEEAALAYEEFVSTRIIPALELPERTYKSRKSLESLAWIENSLLGMILLQMSSSPGWNVKCARRVLGRADEGYIQFEDLRILLFAFDWTRDRRSRKTLEEMTYYGNISDPNTGKDVLRDAWSRMISDAREEYRRGILGPVLEQRNRLFPRTEDELGVNHDVCNRVLFGVKAICTGAVEPKEGYYYSVTDPDCLSILLSRCRRSEKLQAMVDGSRDRLEKYFATDLSGILLYQSKYYVLPETMGLTIEGIRRRHRTQVDMIQQRLSFHGIATSDIQPLI
jgi:hypothetical protein